MPLISAGTSTCSRRRRLRLPRVYRRPRLPARRRRPRLPELAAWDITYQGNGYSLAVTTAISLAVTTAIAVAVTTANPLAVTTASGQDSKAVGTQYLAFKTRNDAGLISRNVLVGENMSSD